MKMKYHLFTTAALCVALLASCDQKAGDGPQGSSGSSATQAAASVDGKVAKLVRTLRELSCASGLMEVAADGYRAVLEGKSPKAECPVICNVLQGIGTGTVWRTEAKQQKLMGLVRELIAEGFDPSVPTEEKENTLAYASTEEMAQLLVEHGCRVKSNPTGQDLTRCRVLSVAKMLVEAGAPTDIPLEDCVSAEVAEFLHSKGATVRTGSLLDCGNAFATKTLLAAGADVKATNKNGATVLMGAGSKEQAEMLIAAGADVNAVDKWGRSALIWNANMPDVVKVLLDHGADPMVGDIKEMYEIHNADTLRLIFQKHPQVKDFDTEDTPLLRSLLLGEGPGYEEAALCLLDFKPAPLGDELREECALMCFLENRFALLRRLVDGKYLSYDDLLIGATRCSFAYFEEEAVKLITEAVEAGGNIDCINKFDVPLLARCPMSMRSYLRSKGAKTFPMLKSRGNPDRYAILAGNRYSGVDYSIDYEYYTWLMEDGLGENQELLESVYAKMTDQLDDERVRELLTEILLAGEAESVKGALISHLCVGMEGKPLLQKILQKEDKLHSRVISGIWEGSIGKLAEADVELYTAFFLNEVVRDDKEALNMCLSNLCRDAGSEPWFQMCAGMLLDHGADPTVYRSAAVTNLERNLKGWNLTPETRAITEKNLEWLKSKLPH